MTIKISLDVEDINSGEMEYLKAVDVENDRWTGDIQLFGDYDPNENKLTLFVESSNDSSLKSIEMVRAGDEDAWSALVSLKNEDGENKLSIWVQMIASTRRSLTNLSEDEYKQAYKKDVAEIKNVKKQLIDGIKQLLDEIPSKGKEQPTVVFKSNDNYENDDQLF